MKKLLFLLLFLAISSCANLFLANSPSPEILAQKADLAESKGLPRKFVLRAPLKLNRIYTLPAGTYRPTQSTRKFFIYALQTGEKKYLQGILRNGKPDYGDIQWYAGDDHPRFFNYRFGEIGRGQGVSESLKKITK